MKAPIFATLLLICSLPLMAQQAPVAAAQPAAATATIPSDKQASPEEIKALFDALQLNKQMEQMKEVMPTLLAQQTKQAINQMSTDIPDKDKMTPEQQQKFTNAYQELMTSILGSFTGDALTQIFSDIYRRHFDRDDILTMTAFYRSPAGQHMIAESPAITQEYMPAAMKLLTDNMKAPMEKFTQQIKAISPAKPAVAHHSK